MNITQLLCSLFLSIALEPWPISSSGHALLVALLQKNNIDESLYNIIEHVSHIIIMLVVLLYFGRAWIDYAYYLINKELIISWIIHGLIIQFITGIIYLVLSGSALRSASPTIGFFISSFLLLSTAWCAPGKSYYAPTLTGSIVLGVLQGCALIPGISRFGILFCYARWQGVSALFSFFLCFLLGFGVNCAGAAMGIYKLYYSMITPQLLNLPVGLTMVVSGLVCYQGFVMIHSLIAHPCFYYLGWYELVIAITSLLLL